MAIKHIKKDQTQTVEIGGNGSEWVLDEGVKINVVGDDGIHNPFAANLGLTIEGSVRATDPNVVVSAVRLAGVNNSLHVAETGRLSGHYAVNLEAGKAHVVNDGKLIATDLIGTAISGASDGFDIENNGRISGGQGIDLYGHGKFVNGEDGLVSGFQAIRVLGATGSDFTNHGRMIGQGWALNAGEGDDRLVNRGRMEGAIDMAGGDDHIDLRRGDTFGNAIGGSGNDVFFIDNSQTEVREGDGEGYDIIWTTANYALEDAYSEFEFLGAKGNKNIALTGNSGDNNISGNRGKNELSGQAGEDSFYSGAGDDHLMGDGGSDTFVFRKGDGHDTVGDFASDGAEQDVVDLHFLSAFKGLADVLAAATDTNDGVVLKLGKGDSLTLSGVTTGDLEMGHFDYA